MKKIKFGEIKINKESKSHILDCLSRNHVTMGEKTKELEMRWSQLFGHEHTVAVSSGTTACMSMCMALYELGAKIGDEIIVPALSFIATANAVRAAGFTPVFVDVKRETLNINEDLIEQAITPKTKAIIAVNLMGKPFKVKKIKEICNKHNLVLLGDCCLFPNEKIITHSGLKLVQEINNSDYVLTHNGNWKRVIQTMKRSVDEKIVEIKTYGSQIPIKLTKNHPILCCKTTDIQKKQELSWVNAGEIKKNDYLVLPRPKTIKDIQDIDMSVYPYSTTNKKWIKKYENRKLNHIKVDNDLMTIIGWFLAEGHCYRQHVEFTLNKNESQNINSLLASLTNKKFDYSLRHRESTIVICLFHKQMMHFLSDNFGNGSKNKKIPGWIIDLPKDKLEILLNSYVLGDGNEIKNRSSNFTVTSISYDLLFAIQIICAKLGFMSSIVQTTKAGESFIQGRKVNVQNKFILRFSKNYNKNKNERRVFLTENYIYYRVREINNCFYNGFVFNFEVEDDNSYCVLNKCVHNCESHGCKVEDKYMESYCNMTAYSCYAAHILFATEMGFVCTNDKKLEFIIRSIRSHGRAPGTLYFDHPMFGLNFKPSDLHASVGLGNVDDFFDIFNKRYLNNQKLRKGLDNINEHCWFIEEDENEINSPHAFSMVLKDGSKLQGLTDTLDKNQIEWKRNFGSMPTQHRCFSYLNYKLGQFPEAEYVGENGIHVGCHQYLIQKEIDFIIKVISDYFNKI